MTADLSQVDPLLADAQTAIGHALHVIRGGDPEIEIARDLLRTASARLHLADEILWGVEC